MKYGTLLVIDDNPSILTALKICLGNTFERILTLPRPDTAPMLLQQEQVDLILLDMNFSLGDKQRTGRLALAPHLPPAPRPHPRGTHHRLCRRAACHQGIEKRSRGFVTKPWDNDELIRVLKDAIDNNTEVATLENFENDYIRKVVDKCHGNISRAAEMLGITRQTLYAKLKR